MLQMLRGRLLLLLVLLRLGCMCCMLACGLACWCCVLSPVALWPLLGLRIPVLGLNCCSCCLALLPRCRAASRLACAGRWLSRLLGCRCSLLACFAFLLYCGRIVR